MRQGYFNFACAAPKYEGGKISRRDGLPERMEIGMQFICNRGIHRMACKLGRSAVSPGPGTTEARHRWHRAPGTSLQAVAQLVAAPGPETPPFKRTARHGSAARCYRILEPRLTRVVCWYRLAMEYVARGARGTGLIKPRDSGCAGRRGSGANRDRAAPQPIARARST